MKASGNTTFTRLVNTFSEAEPHRFGEYIRPSWLLVKNNFFEANQNRSSMVFSIVRPLLQTLGFVLFYSYISGKTSAHPGISQSILTYFMFTLIISSVDVDDLMDLVQTHIYEEKYLSLDRLPINPFGYYVLVILGRNALPLGLLTLITSVYLVIIHSSLSLLILFLPAVVTGFILSCLLYYLIGMVGFLADNLNTYSFNIIFSFLSGQLIPLTILPAGISNVFLIFPFAYTAGALAKNFSQNQPWWLLLSLAMAAAWSVGLLVASNRLWRWGSGYYQERG